MHIKKSIVLVTTILAVTGCVEKITGKKKKVAVAPTSTQTDNSQDTGGGGGSGGGTGVVTKAYGVLFKTTATTDGGYGYGDGNFPGTIAPADTMCTTEATNRGLTGLFKAVIGNNSLRNKTTNWVLKASSEYRRPDGTTVIGTTNADAYFTFPLTNSIDSISATVWSGFTSTYNVANLSTCSGWMDGTPGSDGMIADIGAVTSDAVSMSSQSCNQQHSLLCAEIIPRTTTVAAQASYRRIFPTTITMTAGTGLMGADGANRFDAQCQTDANTKGISDSGKTIYKALVFTNSTSNGVTRRLSCLTAYCANGTGEAVGWVLEPNKQYRRENGTTIIGTTNANAIFDFPLTNSFTGVNEDHWTGFTESWASVTNSVVGNCQFFQSNNVAGSSIVGNGAAVGAEAVNTASMAACSEQKKVLCVEQARTQNVYVDYPGYTF